MNHRSPKSIGPAHSVARRSAIALALALLAGTASTLAAPPAAIYSTPMIVEEEECVPGPNVGACAPGCNPAAMHPIWGVDSMAGCGQGEVGWDSRGAIDWQRYAQGEYVGHARTAHVPEYRLRPDDQLRIFFVRTREVLSRPYELQVGDRLRVESLTAGSSAGQSADTSSTGGGDDDLNREVVVQPDGMVTLPLVGLVPAARRQITVLQQDLEKRYKKYYNVPSITVTPIQINTRLEDILETVDSRAGFLGGRQIGVVITPAGAIQLPGVGTVYLQGLTPNEAKQELEARFAEYVPGIGITVDIQQRAPRFVYVLGQVGQPGRFELEGPTTVTQAIALAGSWSVGANLRQVVVFRRGDDWRLMATMIDVRGALYGRRPVPADEIWLNDSDIVLVPKNAIQAADELIEQVFTRGVYAAVPLEVIWGQGFSSVSSVTSRF
ncbi:MAG: polysaccharide biosynthesis/export family protein [Lacipirellulaceae bacterium]